MKDNPAQYLKEGDIEGALRGIDNIPTREELQELLLDIDRIRSDGSVPIILFARVHVYERLEEYETAFNLAVKAGELGLAAGFYRAGHILSEHRSSFEFDGSALEEARRFFAKGAALGHVWSKFEILRHGSKTRFRIYRFAIAVPTILASLFNNKARMKVLY